LGLLVAIRRLFRGPLQQGWTWRQETTVRFMRWGVRWMGQRGLAWMKQLLVLVEPSPAALRRRFGLEPVRAGLAPGWWFRPPHGQVQVRRVLYYLHGGGYVFCSPATHAHLVVHLARTSDARALALDYRLAPEHPFPAALEDAVAGYQWLLDAGFASSEVVIAGDSAGGGLALATLLSLRDSGDPLPAGAVLLSPWVDLRARDESITENAPYDYLGGLPDFLDQVARAYAGTDDMSHPLISPLYGNLAGLPPLLVHAGEDEMLHGQVTRLVSKLQEAGVPVTFECWPSVIHVWHAFGRLFPEGEEATTSIARFIRQHT
jgi:acetyl esterase/lipase